MKLPFFLSFSLIFPNGAKASDEFFSYRAGQISIDNVAISKLLYDSLKVEEQEANLVSGQFYKNDQYLFCLKDLELEMTHQCTVYLKIDQPWRLSSYHDDEDFGQADIVEAIYEKPSFGTGVVEIFENKIELKIRGLAADKIKEKIFTSSKKYKYTLDEEQVKCSPISDLCTISIPILDEEKKEDSSPL